jgi:hypothetical protein
MSISPAPTEEEAAAVAAAIEAWWPRSASLVDTDSSQRPLAWRFSGRWWHLGRHAGPGRPWH